MRHDISGAESDKEEDHDRFTKSAAPSGCHGLWLGEAEVRAVTFLGLGVAVLLVEQWTL